MQSNKMNVDVVVMVVVIVVVVVVVVCNWYWNIVVLLYMVNKETVDNFIKRYETCKEHLFIYTVIHCVITFYFFLISNFRHVLNVVCFLLVNSPVSEFYIPAFQNTHTYMPMKMERTVFQNFGI